MKNKVITYRRVTIMYQDGETERVWQCLVNGKHFCYIWKWEQQGEYMCASDPDSEYMCGGVTLRECKDVLEDIIERKINT